MAEEEDNEESPIVERPALGRADQTIAKVGPGADALASLRTSASVFRDIVGVQHGDILKKMVPSASIMRDAIAVQNTNILKNMVPSVSIMRDALNVQNTNFIRGVMPSVSILRDSIDAQNADTLKRLAPSTALFREAFAAQRLDLFKSVSPVPNILRDVAGFNSDFLKNIAPTQSIISDALRAQAARSRANYQITVPRGAGVNLELWQSFERFQTVLADDAEFDKAVTEVMTGIATADSETALLPAADALSDLLAERPDFEHALEEPVADLRHRTGLDSDELLLDLGEITDTTAQIRGHRISGLGILLGSSLTLVVGSSMLASGEPFVASLWESVEYGAGMYVYCAEMARRRREG